MKHFFRDSKLKFGDLAVNFQKLFSAFNTLTKMEKICGEQAIGMVLYTMNEQCQSK